MTNNEITFKTEIIIENNFPNRWERQIVIKRAGITLELDKIDSRTDAAKELALELIWAGTALLNHHELFKSENQ